MNEEHIKQIVAATDNLIAQSINDAVAEQFKKQSKPKVNTNLIIGIVGLVVVSLMAFFIVAATNNSKEAVLAQVSEVKAGQSVIAANVSGLNETIENGNADVIASIDGVQNSVTGLQSSVDAVKEQNKVIQSQNSAIQKNQTKVLNRVKSLKEALNAADSIKLARYSECLSRGVVYITFTNADDSLSVKQSKCQFLLN